MGLRDRDWERPVSRALVGWRGEGHRAVVLVEVGGMPLLTFSDLLQPNEDPTPPGPAGFSRNQLPASL